MMEVITLFLALSSVLLPAANGLDTRDSPPRSTDKQVMSHYEKQGACFFYLHGEGDLAYGSKPCKGYCKKKNQEVLAVSQSPVLTYYYYYIFNSLRGLLLTWMAAV